MGRPMINNGHRENNYLNLFMPYCIQIDIGAIYGKFNGELLQSMGLSENGTSSIKGYRRYYL